MNNLGAAIADYEKQLQATLHKALRETMLNDVAPRAEVIFSKHIRSDIYCAYIPKRDGWVSRDPGTGKLVRDTYVRQHSLLYPNIESWEVSASPETIRVTSRAAPHKSPFGSTVYSDESGLLQIVEGPNHGAWKSGFPREASGPAAKEIDGLLDGWIKQGIQHRTGIVLP